MNDLDRICTQLQAENEILKQHCEFLQDSLKSSIDGFKEQSTGYQKTIRFITGVSALMVVTIIIGLAYCYFKYAYV